MTRTIPELDQVEVEVLRMAVADAEMLASRGEVAGGYECLLVGLVRAEEFTEDGEPWAEDLVRKYSQALCTYTKRHGSLRA